MTSSRSWFLRVLPLVVVIALPARAHADPKADAKQHLDKAMELDEQRHFAEALQELMTSYAFDPQPELLYAIAQVNVKLGKCPEAITFYERFLATKPGPAAAAAAKDGITICKTNPPAAEAGPEPVKPPPVVVEPPKPPPVIVAPPKPVPAAPGPRHWYQDKLGDALAGAGLVAGAIALVEYSGAKGAIDDAKKSTDYRTHVDLVDSAHSKRNIAIGLGIGGTVLLGAAIVHYVMFVGDNDTQERAVMVAPTPGGGVVTWSGQF